MSVAITIGIQDDASTPLLRLGNAIQRGAVRMVMGRAVVRQLKAHFGKLDDERPNKLGGKRTKFYEQVGKSVQQPELIGGDGVKIAINQVGFAQRLFGGDITVGENGTKEWFTVPARAEAYGHRARQFNDLHFVFFREGLAALVQNEQTTLGRKKKDGTRSGKTTGGGIFYWLVKSIHQEPDPTVLPPEEGAAVDGERSMGETAAHAGEEYLTTLRDREGGASA